MCPLLRCFRLMPWWLVLTPLTGCVSPELGQQGLSTTAQSRTGLVRTEPHSMLIFGSGPVYAVRMPGVKESRPRQVILEIELLRDGRDATQVYVEDRRIVKAPLYTLATEPMELSELLSPTSEAPQRRFFKAELARGRADRGGLVFLSDLTVKVKNIVYYRATDAEKTPAPSMTYVLFGSGSTLYAMHRLAGASSGFDQLLSVRIEEGVLKADDAKALRGGAVLEVSGRPDRLENAIKEAERFTGFVAIDGRRLPIAGKALKELYREADELKP